ncbi:MAG TPA: hypothetical protein DDW52_05530 [Planctomycetaceae bacterium]|nr:hypothetical protein [Planctomycetaceae bacterium]
MTTRISFSLVHCFGLITLAAVWTAVYKLDSEAERMYYALKNFRDFAPVLLIENRDRLNVLAERMEWSNERAWQVYAPANQRIVLHAENLESSATKEIALPAGRTRIMLRTAMYTKSNQTEQDAVLYIDDVRHLLSHQVVKYGNPWRVPRGQRRAELTVQPPNEELLLIEPRDERVEVREVPWRISLRTVRSEE